MGKEWKNLSLEELCDLMCGDPEEDYEEEEDDGISSECEFRQPQG